MSGTRALASAPTMKTAAEAMIVTRRPYWSESRPAASAPKAAPIGTALTTRPCSKLPRPKSPRMKQHRAGDDPRVVAEQQPAEPGDRRRQNHVPPRHALPDARSPSPRAGHYSDVRREASESAAGRGAKSARPTRQRVRTCRRISCGEAFAGGREPESAALSAVLDHAVDDVVLDRFLGAHEVVALGVLGDLLDRPGPCGGR